MAASSQNGKPNALTEGTSVDHVRLLDGDNIYRAIKYGAVSPPHEHFDELVGRYTTPTLCSEICDGEVQRIWICLDRPRGGRRWRTKCNHFNLLLDTFWAKQWKWNVDIRKAFIDISSRTASIFIGTLLDCMAHALFQNIG